MSAMASQITGVSIVCSTVCWGADKKKHQSSASLAFVRGMHRWPAFYLTKVQRRGKCFPLMTSLRSTCKWNMMKWTFATLFISDHDIVECLSRQAHRVECQHRSSCHMLLPAFWVNILTPCPVVIPVHIMMKSHEVAFRWGLFHKHGLTLITARMSKHMPSKVV